jgi:hypothetical protein
MLLLRLSSPFWCFLFETFGLSTWDARCSSLRFFHLSFLLCIRRNPHSCLHPTLLCTSIHSKTKPHPPTSSVHFTTVRLPVSVFTQKDALNCTKGLRLAFTVRSDGAPIEPTVHGLRVKFWVRIAWGGDPYLY